jgi:hypothetical protein
MLSDIDKARVRMVSDERSQILKSLNELPPTHASRPALETRLAEVEESLKQVFGGGQAPQQAPQRAPAPRNQVFMGGQTALTPEDVAQLEAAESGYFGPGAGLNSALPPVGSSVPPPDYPFPSGDQINDALMAPAATQPTGFFDTLQGNAANRLAPVGQNLRNLPSTVGGNVRESFQNFRRNIGFPVEQPATNAPAIRNIRRIR